MSQLDAIIKRRNNQIERVIKALEYDTKEKAISILVMWLSADDVDSMLETLEKHNPPTTFSVD